MRIGLFAFPDMEILNFAGPYQVFSTASRVAAHIRGTSEDELFSVTTIGTSLDPVRVAGGAILTPSTTIADHGDLTCLILPGGRKGIDRQLAREDVSAWIVAQATTVPIIASVSTGSFLLAQAGLLDGLEATTYSQGLDDMRHLFPHVTVVESRRWVDAGRFVTSGGLSAGIDMALHLVERLSSRDLSVAVARLLDL